MTWNPLSFLGNLMPTQSPVTGQEPGAAPGGIGDMMNRALMNNSNMLGMTGLGLMTAQTADQQRQALMQGYLYGSSMDAANRKEKREEEEKKRKEAQLGTLKEALAAQYPAHAAAIRNAGDTETLTGLLRLGQSGEGVAIDRERLGIAKSQADLERERFAYERDNPKRVPPTIVPKGSTVLGPDGKPIFTPTPDPEDSFKPEMDLRKEYEGVSKGFREVDAAHSRVVALANKPPSGQNDAGILYGYIKMLDPLGAVREGDIAAVQSMSIPEELKTAYARALNGDKMDPAVRQRFLSAAQTVYEAAAVQHEGIRQHYGTLAQKHRMDPGSILGPYERRSLPKPGNESSVNSIPPEQNAAVQELIKRSETNPALRDRLIKQGIIKPQPGTSAPASKPWFTQ
jgi:hypothetical protein